MNRRDLLKLMLSSALAESIDFERLLWVPKPIVTVPALPVTLTLAYTKFDDALTTIAVRYMRDAKPFIAWKVLPVGVVYDLETVVRAPDWETTSHSDR